MAKPNVTVVAEPRVAGSFVYGPLAAKSNADAENGQLAVAFNITNNEALPVTVGSVTISFTGQPSVPAKTAIPVPQLAIPAGTTQLQYLLSPDHVILPVPAPASVSFSLAFDGFTDPVVLSLPLAQYASDGFLFPARSSDLKKGEFWGGSSAVHGGAGGGTQMFAYDLAVYGYNSTAGWDRVIDGTTGNQNSDYHCWGKPIYAMADGTVAQFLDTVADNNTAPNFPVPTPNPVEGNHFYIQHGDVLAGYCHFQLGSMNPDLLAAGATVTEGQFLGLAGNTGNSSEPHLHLQIIRGAVPWGDVGMPLTFRGAYTLEMSQVDTKAWPANTNSPWNLMEGRALPNVFSAVWPGPLKIGWSKKTFGYVLAWAWLIVIGGWMITPGGIDCVKCGRALENVLATVSIAAGIAGLAATAFGAKERSGGKVATRIARQPQLD
jgi:hypothetical protein